MTCFHKIMPIVGIAMFFAVPEYCEANRDKPVLNVNLGDYPASGPKGQGLSPVGIVGSNLTQYLIDMEHRQAASQAHEAAMRAGREALLARLAELNRVNPPREYPELKSGWGLFVDPADYPVKSFMEGTLPPYSPIMTARPHVFPLPAPLALTGVGGGGAPGSYGMARPLAAAPLPGLMVAGWVAVRPANVGAPPTF